MVSKYRFFAVNIAVIFLLFLYLSISFYPNLKPSTLYKNIFSQRLINSENNNLFPYFSELNIIQNKVKTTDEYLKSLSKLKRKTNNSILIYPNEMFEMTKIPINHNNCSELFGKDLVLLVMVFNCILQWV